MKCRSDSDCKSSVVCIDSEEQEAFCEDDWCHCHTKASTTPKTTENKEVPNPSGPAGNPETEPKSTTTSKPKLESASASVPEPSPKAEPIPEPAASTPVPSTALPPNGKSN